VSDCCLAPRRKYFSCIMERTSYISMEGSRCPLCIRQTCLLGCL